MAGTSSSTIFSKIGYQYRSVSGGAVHFPPLGSGLRLQPTNPSSSTQRSSSATDDFSPAPGDCGSWQTPMNVAGTSPPTRTMRLVHPPPHRPLSPPPPPRSPVPHPPSSTTP